MENLVLPPYLERLHAALMVVDGAPVEYDGHTLIVSTALSKAGIEHERVMGSVSNQYGTFVIAPHQWIKIGGYILDYRLRMWVRILSGEIHVSGAPHGIFINNDAHGYQYTATKVLAPADLSMQVLNFMTDGFAGKLVIPERETEVACDG
ncbi:MULTISPECIES: hypothetical protein [Providencia]|uniref:Uncharacterized protein n=1 Tax=Providencia rettgeri TaxID=587 RepID=A0AAW6UQX9_PRORE|nr:MULTISPECIES: hypothetical protein [Providencia]MDI9095028.1 hypothetical protein [Providencia rettgeri]